MKLQKIIETGINIESVDALRSKDFNLLLINILKKKYVGRCFSACYILDILRIVRRGDLLCKSKTLDGNLHVDIQFEALVLIYDQGEIIHNCKIIQVDRNDIIAKSEYCSIKIKGNSSTSMYTEGKDSVPVVVYSTLYNIFDTEVSVYATPLIPVPREIIYYRISGEYNIKNYKATIDETFALQKEIQKFNAKAIKFFVDLLYPYKKIPDWKGEKYSIQKLMDNEIKDGETIYIPDRHLNEDLFYITTPQEIEMEMSAENLYKLLISDFKKNLMTLLDFLREYDIEKSKRNANIWKVYSSGKK